MIDLSHVPEIPGLSVFLPQGTSADSWQIWNKPRGFVMVSIYAIGPGGGGGAGGRTIAPAAGGGGGGSGGISRLTIPIFMLPDSLYIRVSPGGSGGAGTAGDGTSGNVAFAPLTTMVAAAPSTTAQYLYLEANAGGGGIGGTSGGGGGGGALGAIATARPFTLLGSALFIAGAAGAAGAGNGIGGSITQGTATQIYGGAGGGSSGQAGGVVNALSGTPFIAISTSPSVGAPAANGFSWNTVFPGKMYGGCGGRGTSGSAGGAGSAWGAGGGGGGGLTTGTGNRGGDGGPGAVIIQCW